MLTTHSTRLSQAGPAQDGQLGFPRAESALTFLGRSVIAMVWVYEGLYCKLLHGQPSHYYAMPTPGLAHLLAWIVLGYLGLGEVLLAGWVLSAKAPCWAAAVQTAHLAGMTSAGLIFAPPRILDGGGMLVHGLVLVLLVWIVGLRTAAQEARWIKEERHACP